MLFNSEEDCGENMWELAFVTFWLYISIIGCVCCGVCCVIGAALGGALKE